MSKPKDGRKYSQIPISPESRTALETLAKKHRAEVEASDLTKTEAAMVDMAIAFVGMGVSPTPRAGRMIAKILNDVADTMSAEGTDDALYAEIEAFEATELGKTAPVV